MHNSSRRAWPTKPIARVGLFCVIAFAGAPLFAQSDSRHAAADLGEVHINDGFAELVKAVKPAVVNISTTGTAAARNTPRFRQPPELEEFFRRFFGAPPNGDGRARPPQRKTTALGSGFIIAAEGLVVTNNHVIADADEIEVVFDDGLRLPAKLRGSDPNTDLALLEIKSDQPLPFVKFGDSDAARVGDWVVAIGNPFGLGGTTTSGIISARGRDIQAGPLDDFIQIDAPINRGNSGGPLFNIRGEVIGVNTAIYSPSGGNVGIGFAIPSAIADNVISQLRRKGVVERGFLGVQIQVVTEEIADILGLEKARGALVSEIIADSPAEKSGLEASDIILSFDGKPVEKMRDLPKLVALTKNNAAVEVEVWRNRKRKTLRVTVGKRESAAAPVADSAAASAEIGKLGLQVAALSDADRERHDLDEQARGVAVVAVDADGIAAQRGIRAGDLIKRVHKRRVNSPQEVQKAIQAARKAKAKSLLLLLVQDRRTRFVVLPLDS